MADLAKELEELHAAVVRVIRNRVDLDDAAASEISNDDLRVAMQLLKQNSVTANLAEANTEQLKAQMAKKLNFSALQEKVIPLRTPEALPLPHKHDEDQSA